MHHLAFAGAAVLALTAAAEAQEQEQWRPVDCAGLEANSLEAAVLRCDPASLSGSKETGSATAPSDRSSWQDAWGEGLPMDPPASDGEPSVIGISSKTW